MESPDFLVIGGGTAGTVMAARLSEDSSQRVLLVEAGNDTRPGDTPDDIRDIFPRSATNASYLWGGLKAATSVGKTRQAYAQARVMGGGSSINALAAMRGMPSTYDGWVAAGAEGWSWADVQPWFRKLEDDYDREPTYGPRGSNPIRRVPVEYWPAYATALRQAASQQGYGYIPDINEDLGDGFFQMPLSATADQRSTTADTYLTTGVRQRQNLRILPNAVVEKLLFNGLDVVGAEVVCGAESLSIMANKVIVSAGAIHSPSLLMRSGVGPSEVLQGAGIRPLVNRVGVGANLQNHPCLFFALTLSKAMRMASNRRHFLLAGLRASSGHVGGSTGDLSMFMTGRVSQRAFGTSVGMLGCALYAPHSRGVVRLAGPEAVHAPQVDFNMLDDPRDAPRLLVAAQLAHKLLCQSAGAYHEATLLPASQSLDQLSSPGFFGNVLSLGAQTIMNSPRLLRELALIYEFGSGRRVNSQKAGISDSVILSSVTPMYHVAGTCSIGRVADPAAVVDRCCHVIGVNNLYVVDASVMPIIPNANTNLTTVMIAERVAAGIRSRRVDERLG